MSSRTRWIASSAACWTPTGAWRSPKTSVPEFYHNSYKPILNVNEHSVTIGRVNLDWVRRGRGDSSADSEAKLTFSWTKNSSVLLERLAICVRQLEPVLLVGETGTGKTSCVQYLARLLGRSLLVINLNQQSDSADLLGGYKPVDFKYKIAPVRQQFEALFQVLVASVLDFFLLNLGFKLV